MPVRKKTKFENEGVQITQVGKKDQNKKADTRRKLRHSNFHLTINTNKRYNPESHQLQEECAKLQAAVSALVEPEVLRDMILIKEEGAVFDSIVKEVRTKGGVERGPEKNQVHCHLMVCIAHYTRVQLDIPAIRSFICEQTGLGNVYVHVRVHRSSEDAETILRGYLSKNV